MIDKNLLVRTIRPIEKGEELFLFYNLNKEVRMETSHDTGKKRRRPEEKHKGSPQKKKAKTTPKKPKERRYGEDLDFASPARFAPVFPATAPPGMATVAAPVVPHVAHAAAPVPPIDAAETPRPLPPDHPLRQYQSESAASPSVFSFVAPSDSHPVIHHHTSQGGLAYLSGEHIEGSVVATLAGTQETNKKEEPATLDKQVKKLHQKHAHLLVDLQDFKWELVTPSSDEFSAGQSPRSEGMRTRGVGKKRHSSKNVSHLLFSYP